LRAARVVPAALLLTAALLPVVAAGPPAAAQTAPDGSRSHISQEVADREPLPGGGWRVVIEATLDSNAVCHVLLSCCCSSASSNPSSPRRT
jgi:hypothetical protein